MRYASKIALSTLIMAGAGFIAAGPADSRDFGDARIGGPGYYSGQGPPGYPACNAYNPYYNPYYCGGYNPGYDGYSAPGHNVYDSYYAPDFYDYRPIIGFHGYSGYNFHGGRYR